MGGRGASSGRYKRGKQWHTYGDEFHTIHQFRNIKFVKINEGANTAPMETMTNGRVYVTVGNNDQLKSISYYSGSGKRKKQIDLDHNHTIDGVSVNPHVHLGYNHDELGSRVPNKKELKMIDRVFRIWQNKNEP